MSISKYIVTTYVQPNFWILITGKEDDFVKRTGQDDLEAAVDYDFHSIMHYKYNQFAKVKSLDTIVPKTKYSLSKTVLGQRDRLSALDIERITWMYKCGKCEYQCGRTIDTLNTFNWTVCNMAFKIKCTELKKIYKKNTWFHYFTSYKY